MAESPFEKQKLDQRYQDAINDCASRGVNDVANQFLSECSNSVAVIACPLKKFYRYIATGTDVFETYYDFERLRLRASLSAPLDWEKLRPQAEIELLGNAKNIEQIHYACLSIGGQGLESYGDCIVQLSSSMVAHRTSCFEGNTAVVYAVEHDFSRFLRSTWDERPKICLAMFGNKLNSTPNLNDFASILVHLGTEPIDDEFVELHVFGPITSGRSNRLSLRLRTIQGATKYSGKRFRKN